MKINPIVIHDSANKWMKGNPEPTDKMRKKRDSLVGLRSRDDLSCRWKAMAGLVGQVPSLLEPLDVLLLDGRGHPFASCSGSGYLLKTLSSMERRKAWALELEH